MGGLDKHGLWVFSLVIFTHCPQTCFKGKIRMQMFCWGKNGRHPAITILLSSDFGLHPLMNALLSKGTGIPPFDIYTCDLPLSKAWMEILDISLRKNRLISWSTGYYICILKLLSGPWEVPFLGICLLMTELCIHSGLNDIETSHRACILAINPADFSTASPFPAGLEINCVLAALQVWIQGALEL